MCIRWSTIWKVNRRNPRGEEKIGRRIDASRHFSTRHSESRLSSNLNQSNEIKIISIRARIAFVRVCPCPITAWHDLSSTYPASRDSFADQSFDNFDLEEKKKKKKTHASKSMRSFVPWCMLHARRQRVYVYKYKYKYIYIHISSTHLSPSSQSSRWSICDQVKKHHHPS